jgi:hypothetical protein
MITGLYTRGGVDIDGEIRPLSNHEKIERDIQLIRAALIKSRRVLRAGPRVSERLTVVDPGSGKVL